MSPANQFPQRFVSQTGEDYLLEKMFRGQPTGTFVEIGCIDGLRFSNTFVLEQQGWRGLCIEAHSDYIEMLQCNRPNSTVVHSAVGGWDGAEVTFFANARGSLSTLDATLETRWRSDYGEYFTGFQEQRVIMRTITSLLREHAMPQVDVLSIDVEGCEVNVLQGLDLAQHRPRVILIERQDVAQEREIDAILLPAGYIKGFHVGANIFYSTEAALLGVVAGKRHDLVLTYTQHPLDNDGDQTRKVSIDLTAFSFPVGRMISTPARSTELQRLIDELRSFDPDTSAFEAAFTLERALIEMCSIDAHILDALPPQDQWTSYVRALLLEASGDYKAALPLFESSLKSNPDDWRPAFHLARCADATREAHAMRRGEELHWDIISRFPDCTPSHHVLDANVRRFAFHGDPQYQGMVTALLTRLPVTDFIETGTFLGRSTAFVAHRWPNVNVYTVEINPGFFQTASRRLVKLPNVKPNLAHSLEFLKDLIQDDQLGALPVFFLGPHRGEDWPLLRELELIRKGCPRAIIIIDDFRLPGQPQLPYDDYGDFEVCAFESILPYIDADTAATNLLPHYSREAVPDYISRVGHVVLFQNASAEYTAIAASQPAQRHYFTLDVKREFPRLGAIAREPVEAIAPSSTVAPVADIISHTAERGFPFLVSFPRTGSHWMRMVLELYLDRPLLTRSFFEHASPDYLLFHTHDLELSVLREDVLYLYRDPVDTVFSQMRYHGEDSNDRQRVAFWADLYGQHAYKWLCTERFTHRKTVLSYEDLRREPEIHFAAAIRHLGGVVDRNRLRECLAEVDRSRVKERTAHDPRVVNLHDDYTLQRDNFRSNQATVVWNAFLQGRDLLADRFGQPPVTVSDGYKPAQHPRQGSDYRKIIGLVPGKNESRHIEFCIRALAQVCDSIVYFDDDSTDDSVAIVTSIAQECRVERIIRKRDGEFHETIRRALPLEAGRELGGTHFVVIDADEAFTANLAEADLLRRHILALQPGDTLELAWIQLWRSVRQYRHDDSVWTNNYKAIVFADDGSCHYDETFIHLERTPSGLGGKRYRISGYEYGLMHFQFVNWRHLLVKQAWYRCLERIHDPQKSAQLINDLYAPSKDERGLGLRETPHCWFAGYPFFDVERLQQPDTWREQQVLDWFHEHGEAYFHDLDIWDVDWGEGPGLTPVVAPRVAADELVADGERRFASGDADGARACFEHALKCVPRHAVALNNLAVLCWENDDPGQALLHQGQALESSPDNPEVVFNSVQMLHAAGRTKEAENLCVSYLNNHPLDSKLRDWLSSRNTGTTDVTAEAGETAAPAGGAYEFSNDWFRVHRETWQQHLRPWANRFTSLDILEIGSYEGASACWMLDNLVRTRKSRLVCIDAWTNNPSRTSWESDMELVFQRFQRNLHRTGKSSQVRVLRGDSSELLAELEDQSFDLIYVDGDHSEEGVYRDSLQAVRLLRTGGMVLWDDYFWSEGDTVKRGVDRACAELGIQPQPFGQNMMYEKSALPVTESTSTQEGEHRFAAGDLAGARACFERAVVADAGNAIAHNNLAVLSWQEGEPAEALAHLARALEAVPDCRDAVLNGVKILSTLDRTDDALLLSDAWLTDHPEDDEVRLLGESLRDQTKVLDGVSTQPRAHEQNSYRVSAIVSTCNSESFLRGCLEDLEAQTIADQLEIIVIDSGSEENEHGIVQEFQRRYENIRYLRTARESLYAAWNRAVTMARGCYLTSANTDDRHRHDAFEVMARMLDSHPEVGLVYGDCLITRTPNETFAANSAERVLCWPDFSVRQALQYCLFGPQPMWRRTLHAEIGAFNPDYQVAGDYEFFLRSSIRYGALHIDQPLGLYFEGEGLELGDPERAHAETARLLHHARRNTPLEDIYPALRQMPGDATARSAALCDFAGTLSTGLYPDPELAAQYLQAAKSMTPQLPQQHPVVTALTPLVPPERNRQPWPAGPSPSSRRPGFSFCIISGGQRPDKLQRLIDSIHKLEVLHYEIIVAGIAAVGDEVRYLDRSEAARTGRTSVLRNAAAAASRYDHIVFCDDDIRFTAGWLTGIERALCDHDIAVGRLLNSDGTRHWDWATVGGPRGHITLEYAESDSHLYLTSGLLAMRALVWEENSWDEQRGYRQDEDVEYSQRLLGSGLRVRCCIDSVAIHDDDKYTQVGRVVLTRSAAGLQRWCERGWSHCSPEQMLQAAKECLNAGEPADAADWLRYLMHIDPHNSPACTEWEALVKRYGGSVEGLEWSPEGVEAPSVVEPLGNRTDAPTNSAQALNKIGEAHFTDGNLDAAQQAFEQALAADSHDVDVLNNLGVLFWQRGAPDEALGYLRRALEIQPDHREAILNCAAISDAARDNEDVRARYDRYPRNPPEYNQNGRPATTPNADVQQPTISIEDLNAEGERLFCEGDLESAKAVFLEAYERSPGDGTTCNNLGILLSRTGHLDEALVYMAQSLESEPGNPVFVDNSIQLLIDSGREQDAIKLRNAFVNDYPEHAGTLAAAGNMCNAGTDDLPVSDSRIQGVWSRS